MSVDAPQSESEPNPIAPVGNIVVDDDGRIASDLLCWTCGYNLRSIELDAACPECGTPVGITLEHSDGRKARPFSLYTLNPIAQTIGLIYGMLGPALMVVLAGSNPMHPLNVDWQSGQTKDYIGTMLAGRAMWAFYPFLIWAYIGYAVLMIAPVAMGRQWWVKAGLWLGCVLGLQYQLIVTTHLMWDTHHLWTAIALGLVPLAILATVVYIHTARDRDRIPVPRKKRSGRATSLYVGGTLVALVVVCIVSRGAILVPILFAGPYLMLLFMSAALCRLYRTDYSEPVHRFKPIPTAATVGGYVLAWPVAITQAQAVYNSLPTSPPSCYICTASAHGHAWLTRAKPVRFADGQVMLVTRQMQTLKAAEHLIAARCPSLHRYMRTIYDTVGPKIANKIQSPWLADVSYLLFVPIACLATLTLKLLARSHRIDLAYKG